ncbi:signal peptidase II [Actibacterium sp. 188UL27-1]|uniref:signal peptidase II n=1 Tax=Actibacterium sp. 188UL27-1 TaxID=2786961 RepID=UPI001956E878|nr:signal peptidase II [Actibacterium sp. 188UL27-1]MBM7068508.1 signal peptidase II [Actibacterium sp. 188UL27-1]
MRLLGISAIVAFVLDQVTKYGAIYGLALAEGDVDVFPPLLVLRKGLNTGINFGLLSGLPFDARWLLIGLAVVISAALVLWASRSFDRPIQFIAAGFVVGGALGNALDRVIHPGVLDFLNMSCCGISNPYIFNVADIFIFAGAIGIALFTGEKKAA